MANLTIEYGSLFRKEFANFPVKDQDAIVEFVEHIQNFGFTNLEGRNKSSDNVHKKPIRTLLKKRKICTRKSSMALPHWYPCL
ncbi:putative phage associated protein [Glaesserella parasuis ZJ0906]|uniref:Putative phage associated protein n=1 Tax=Glaesserella parasuis ZJ0906 TaxID=1322346 RepID=A0A806JFU4_GLAPU|nr:putative phage associated protein [Glaesserella parasuis ZJ0906]